MKYNALSHIFIRVRELSWLQWHPFSVSSSPLDGQHHLSVLIKVLGDWTGKLRDNCSNVLEQSQEGLPCQPYSRMTASVEEPYGHDPAYHLAYENLILVAGGIGISPLLAILRDIMHRTRENKCGLPKNVLVVWAVKRSKELSLLSMIDPKFICPSISEKVYLEIQTYVTQELEPPLEDGNHSTSEIYSFPVTNGSSMSGLVGTANNIWSGIYVFSSTIGFIILFDLMEALYVTPFDVKCRWFKGLLFVICMIVSVVVFGGVVVFLWNQWERRASNSEKYANGREISDIAQYDDPKMQNNASESRIARMNSTHYGCRPNFPAIFSSVSEQWRKVLVGVIACGPQSLQTSVAAECRSRTIWRREDQPIFHFYCHSFDL